MAARQTVHIAHHTVPVVLDRRHLENARDRGESVRERGALALFPKWPPHAVTASELCNLQLSNRAREFSLAFAALFFRCFLAMLFVQYLHAKLSKMREQEREREVYSLLRYASVGGKGDASWNSKTLLSPQRNYSQVHPVVLWGLLANSPLTLLQSIPAVAYALL